VLDIQQTEFPVSKYQPAHRPPETILIAEDDRIFRRVLQSWLEKFGYRVIVADNGLKAWEILQQENAPALLILDWMMPGIDGPELCLRIRGKRHSFYPYILLVTAKDEKQDIVQGLASGADDYLTKPFDPGELQARLQVGKRILDLQRDLIRAREEIQFQASHDGLTGMWNRTTILNLLGGELQRGARARTTTGVLMMDVDHFKKVNDEHGHLNGDAVLREISERIKLAVRSYDFVGRYGGEEFLAVLPDCSPGALRAVAERIRRAVAGTPVCTETASMAMTVSIGGVTTSNPTPDLELISTADSALYAAKSNGRNRVEIASAIASGQELLRHETQDI
jgi:two-component system cell cycle response regulator